MSEELHVEQARNAEQVRIKTRAILTRDLAREIYQYKIVNMQAVASAIGRHACILAGKYGVSEKTIRDVWTARTWSEETGVLDPERRMHTRATEFTSSGCRTGDALLDHQGKQVWARVKE